MDCHLHSRFSPDANGAGAKSPDEIAADVRRKGLRGFIITDHLDVGHWGDYTIDFDEYFGAWNSVREKNPDLTIYIGLEVGFEPEYVQETYELIKDLPLEYVINSVHYWQDKTTAADGTVKYEFDEVWKKGKLEAYTKYLKQVLASLDAPYDFNTVGHIGFPERYAPYSPDETPMRYAEFKPLMDEIIAKAVRRGVKFEQNTNAGGVMRLPRADFLTAYKRAGGVRPMLGSDAHTSDAIGQYFDIAQKFLDVIF